MTSTPPTLTQELAGLRQSAEADDAHGWLPAALHALIMACLARLFARLEQVFLLWTAGDLPPQRPTTPRPITPPTTRAPSRPRTHRASRQPRTRPSARTTKHATPRQTTVTTPAPSLTPAPKRGIPAVPPPSNARAPPPPRAPIRRNNRLARIADPRPFSFHHQINHPSQTPDTPPPPLPHNAPDTAPSPRHTA